MREHHRIWTMPVVLAVMMLVALIGALIVEGAWDHLASLLLLAATAYPLFLGFRRAGRV